VAGPDDRVGTELALEDARDVHATRGRVRR
jgi:hypothetical protein